MLTAISTASIPGNLREKLNAASEAGFQGVEIFENDLVYYDRQPSEVGRMAADLGLEIVSLQPFRNFEGLPGALKKKALERARRKFDLMKDLGARLLVVSSNESADTSQEFSHSATDLGELADLGQSYGMTIGYEPGPRGRLVRDYETAGALVEMTNRDNLGLVLDGFLASPRQGDAFTPESLPMDRVVLVQLADAPTLDMDSQQLGQHFRCFPGQGDLRTADFLAAVLRAGYVGPISLDVVSDEFRSASPQQIAADGMRSLRWLDEQLELPQVSEAAKPIRLEASSAAVESVEFVELATEGGEAALLCQSLESIGFVKTHVHRSKTVSLYRQGDINLVINSEPDSFAHSYYSAHGSSVCALGLGTENAEALARRSRYYGCEPFFGRVSTGELQIPAIRGVDGGLLYFVERRSDGRRFFDVDFERISDADPVGLGLKAIDHIAQAVGTTEFLSALLFYRSVLNLRPERQFDIGDLHGIVHSRTLQNSDRSVQVAINASHARRSITQRFRSHYAGSGVQHIAMRCDDIFAVAERLNRTHILPIQAGYYSEIASEFGLDPNLIERMRRLNILYDEDENGQYFQIYTRQTRRFFLEIVQRDNYIAFGQRNASARMAAQAREYEHIQDLLLNYESPEPD